MITIDPLYLVIAINAFFILGGATGWSIGMLRGFAKAEIIFRKSIIDNIELVGEDG